jgi:hypothetical protein
LPQTAIFDSPFGIRFCRGQSALNCRRPALVSRGDEPQGELENSAEELVVIERLTAGQAFHKTVQSGPMVRVELRSSRGLTVAVYITTPPNDA